MERSLVGAVHILTHPMRFKIVQTLRKSGQPMFIGQIAEEIKEDPRLVSFHLTVMLQHGFVEGEWKPSPLPRSKGKAVKYYRLTPKVEEAFAHCVEWSRK